MQFRLSEERQAKKQLLTKSCLRRSVPLCGLQNESGHNELTVMASYIIGTPEFIKNLDGWVDKNDQKFAEYLSRNKNGIPPMFTNYTHTLYRGMIVNEDFLNSLLKGGAKFAAHTSWSKDMKMAKRFMNDPKYKTTKNVGTPVLIKKKIPQTSIIFDIHSFIMFMGESQLSMLGMDDLAIDSALNEQEILVKKGITIKQNEVEVLG